MPQGHNREQRYGKRYWLFQENEFCKIYPNAFFGYWRVTVEQPLKNDKGARRQKTGRLNPDPKLRDYESISFLRKDECSKLVPQTIEEYVEGGRPYLPEAWIDESKTGYKINFIKYFYEFKPLRSLAKIRADILKQEAELENSNLE